MRVSEDDIRKVLAMFDKEDIPYINFDYLFSNNILEIDNKKSKVRVKDRKGINDRAKKR